MIFVRGFYAENLVSWKQVDFKSKQLLQLKMVISYQHSSRLLRSNIRPNRGTGHHRFTRASYIPNLWHIVRRSSACCTTWYNSILFAENLCQSVIIIKSEKLHKISVLKCLCSYSSYHTIPIDTNQLHNCTWACTANKISAFKHSRKYPANYYNDIHSQLHSVHGCWSESIQVEINMWNVCQNMLMKFRIGQSKTQQKTKLVLHNVII